MKKSLFLALLLALSSCWAPSPEELANKDKVVNSMIEALKKQHPDSPGLNAEELSQMREGQTPLTLVDVRSPTEREVSTLPGAQTSADFSSDQLVVVYDTFGYRAIDWIEKQKTQGLKNALFLEGGVIAWAHAGGEFVDGEGLPTKKVHVLNEAWAMLPDGYEAISE